MFSRDSVFSIDAFSVLNKASTNQQRGMRNILQRAFSEKYVTLLASFVTERPEERQIKFRCTLSAGNNEQRDIQFIFSPFRILRFGPLTARELLPKRNFLHKLISLHGYLLLKIFLERFYRYGKSRWFRESGKLRSENIIFEYSMNLSAKSYSWEYN